MKEIDFLQVTLVYTDRLKETETIFPKCTTYQALCYKTQKAPQKYRYFSVHSLLLVLLVVSFLSTYPTSQNWDNRFVITHHHRLTMQRRKV